MAFRSRWRCYLINLGVALSLYIVRQPSATRRSTKASFYIVFASKYSFQYWISGASSSLSNNNRAHTHTEKKTTRTIHDFGIWTLKTVDSRRRPTADGGGVNIDSRTIGSLYTSTAVSNRILLTRDRKSALFRPRECAPEEKKNSFILKKNVFCIGIWFIFSPYFSKGVEGFYFIFFI